MKQLFLSIFLFSLAFATIAQEDQAAAPGAAIQKNEYALMNNGKVYLMNESAKTKTLLEAETKLNTSLVKPDGTVIYANGQSLKLKEGEMVHPNGLLITTDKFKAQPSSGALSEPGKKSQAPEKGKE